MVGNIYACVYEYATRGSFGSESHLIFENKNKSNSKAKVSFFFLLWPRNFPSVVSCQVQEATKTNKKGKKKRLFSLLPIPAENWDSKACEGQFVEADLPILSMFLGSKGKGVLPIYGNRCKSKGQNCVWKVKKNPDQNIHKREDTVSISRRALKGQTNISPEGNEWNNDRVKESSYSAVPWGILIRQNGSSKLAARITRTHLPEAIDKAHGAAHLRPEDVWNEEVHAPALHPRPLADAHRWHHGRQHHHHWVREGEREIRCQPSADSSS